ncbi:hypothetical protein FB45DRAFT_278014 [Roridomyces roridus]|uniref:F-box domain-containing protein n=1 Tax=Roridomyces roridus TaxID=1738132 RepID=A0AAD7FU21_9AGAR|nr:hypothetical protein FB45DRAFT_278014 [Roridomyces roridus]
MAASETAAQLRANITDISSSIARQRALLKDLEKQKSEAESLLNAVLDPMGRLPLEIATDIFKQCLPSTPTFDNYKATPAVLTEICRAWRKLAISTPTLWTSISDAGVPPEKFSSFFRTWGLRTKGLPLSVRLHKSLTAPDQYSLHSFARRVRTLEVHSPRDGGLRGIAGYRFSDLKSLKVTRCMVDYDWVPFHNARASARLLACAPNLEECTFVNLRFTDDIHSDPTTDVATPLTHASLKRLQLGASQAPTYPSDLCSSVILQYLTLPALESLCISDLDIAPEDVVSFLTRSSPPLRSLYLSSEHYEDGEIEHYLRLVPNLTDLDIRYEDEFATPLLWVFRDANDLLPNLRSLTMRGVSVTEADYACVVNILQNRRETLGRFSLIVDDADVVIDGPHADVLHTAVASHRKQGMQVHFGTEDNSRF